MSFQLYTGGSGSGKSHRLFCSVIREALAHPENRYVILVPEQFSMQTQQELVRLHPAHGILNIDVLSFARLAWRVLEETGAGQAPVLTETGKNLLLRRVAGLCAEDLGVLKNRVRRPGTVSQVKSVLSEFTQYDITPEDMDRMILACEGQDQLKEKLEDIRVLYASFREFCKDRYITAEEVLDLLAGEASRSAIIRESHFVLDGFTGFTPQQRKVLRQIFALSPSVRAAVTIPADEPLTDGPGAHEVFSLSRRTIRTLLDIAAETGCEVLPPVVMPEPAPRFTEGSRIAQIEKRIFRYGRRAGAGHAAGREDEIVLISAANPAAEVRETARRILGLTAEEGIRCREIAVITGSPEVYEREIRRIFDESRIPYFIDSRKELRLNPCLELIRGALQMVREDFSQGSVFRILRTGLTGISREETDYLENWCMARGIRGRRRWEKPFDDARAEESRAAFMELMGSWAGQAARDKAKAEEWARILYDLLVRTGMQEKLAEMKEMFEARGEDEHVSEYAQVYPVIIRILEETAELIGEEEMDPGEFADIFEAGLAEARIGMIPPGLDRVQVGDVERTRLAPIRVLFFLGVNDGFVPASDSGSGLVSDMEREYLKSTGIELAPTARENSAISQFYLYLLLTKPSERLRISYSRSGSDGAQSAPSYLIGTMKKLFPDLTVTDADREERGVSRALSPQMGFPVLARGLRLMRAGELSAEDSAQITELLRYYLRFDAYRSRALRILDGAFIGRGSGQLPAGTAPLLYGSSPVSSITRIEGFAACPFAHFAGYGLRLRERKIFTVDPADVGSVFHDALERFSGRIAASDDYTWHTLPDALREEWMEEAAEAALQAQGREVFFDTGRSSYTAVRIRRILQRTAWALQQQLQAGDFEPDGSEVRFDGFLPEAEGGGMRLTGRIDRIDVYEKDGEVFVKVVDYKSGGTKLDPTDLYYGLQLQLPVYLGAALLTEESLRPGKTAVPAGIFYYHLQDPFADAGCQDVETAILKALRPDGLICRDPEVVTMLDRDLSTRGGAGGSPFIPASMNKDGTLSKSSRAAGRDELAMMGSFADRKVLQLGSRILQGETAVSPYRRKKKTACDWCAYRAVCGFDRRIPGMEYRELGELTRDDLFDRIKKQEGTKEGGTDGDAVD